jgi:hypothetical protein
MLLCMAVARDAFAGVQWQQHHAMVGAAACSATPDN